MIRTSTLIAAVAALGLSLAMQTATAGSAVMDGGALKNKADSGITLVRGGHGGGGRGGGFRGGGFRGGGFRGGGYRGGRAWAGRGHWRGGRWYGGGYYGCPWPYYGPYCYPYW